MLEEFEESSFVDEEPVELLEVRRDVNAVWKVEDESGCRVLYGLESSGQLSVDSGIECFAVVQFAGDDGIGDGLAGVDRELLEGLLKHL